MGRRRMAAYAQCRLRRGTESRWSDWWPSPEDRRKDRRAQLRVMPPLMHEIKEGRFQVLPRRKIDDLWLERRYFPDQDVEQEIRLKVFDKGEA